MAKQKTKKGDYEKDISAYNMAMKAFHKGEYQKAAGMLKAFLEKDVSEKELVDRAQIYLSICQDRQKAIPAPLKTFNDYYQYSVYKINNGEYEEALELLSKALEIKPKEGEIFYLMADAYCMMGEADNCLEYLKKAFQIDKFFKILAQNEGDFESLWEDKRFILITRVK